MWDHLRKTTNRQLKAQITKISQGLPGPQVSPDEVLGELFRDVQMRRVFPDGMTFVDLIPAHRLSAIVREYERERQHASFNLDRFIQRHFKEFMASSSYVSNPDHTPAEHIDELWNVLTRHSYSQQGSLLSLPYPYIVPGGRFSAQWYWDSYFTMLGLAASDRWDLVEGMVKNFAFMLRKYGFIPSGNRTYYLSRSQPPFFVHMVHLLAQKKGKNVYVRYLPYMLAEYTFWMRGAKGLTADTPAQRRVVLMHDGSVLNRYYDDKRTPRPEMYREDVDTALLASERLASKVYLDIRAAAESGWDFSSRWFEDPAKLSTIATTDIAPVDLNCLLLQLEQAIADTYVLLHQPLLARPYQKKADQRTEAIRNYCWSSKHGFFFDYNFINGKRTRTLSLAGVFPLYALVATKHQAKLVAERLTADFLQPGGLLTTLSGSGQQWDSPNGWAPLHWVAIQGLRNYGYHELADDIKRRWVGSNITVYGQTGKMVEKYNVVQVGSGGSGGEYPLQDGFGWTNGVLRALLAEN